jgi:hypothetical protein
MEKLLARPAAVADSRKSRVAISAFDSVRPNVVGMAVNSITAGGAFEAFGAAGLILGAGSTIATRKDKRSFLLRPGSSDGRSPDAIHKGSDLTASGVSSFPLAVYSPNVIQRPSLQAERRAP